MAAFLVVCLVNLVRVISRSFDEQYAGGVIAGARAATTVTQCDHVWEKWRDEKTEDHGWRCTHCPATRT